MSQLLDRISNNCIKYPDRIAFQDDNRALTYRELWEESGRVTSWLKANGYGKEDICLIVLPRSVSSMASMLGVLRAGCAFCNIDSSYPPERIAFIRSELNQKCEIDEETYKTIQNEQQPYDGYIEPDPHDAAFVVYTSGSTGRPKGVLHEMGNIDFCLSLYPPQDEYEELHTCFTAPFYAVASILLALNCMCVARTTYIVSERLLRDLRGMHKFLIEHEIVDTFLPPSFIRVYTNPSPFLREVLMGGEHADGIYYEGGKPSLLNYYSMTEAGFPLLVMPVTKRYDRTPAGKPVVPGIDLHLEDEEGNRIEGPGEGEICFKNFYVRGYINLPEEASKVFRDGFVHTGDIARRDESGFYTIVGRLDDMFNINGNRIEPTEIETVCRKELGLSWCAAKGFEKEGVVALYYTDPITIDEEEAREKLKHVLPYYMIPSYFIHIEKAPISATGKVNRNVFKLPETVRFAEYAAPRNDLEEKLTAAMAQVLKLERVGIKDDFFDLGGNSMSAMELLSKLDIEGLNISHIYNGRTAEKISDLFTAESASGLSDEKKEEIGRTKRFPLDFQQRRIWVELNNGTHDFITCYQLSPLISIEKFRDTLNAYIRSNSTFNAVMQNDKEGPVQTYSPNTPVVEIEKMSEEEVKELQKTFIRPFEYGEPLARFRLIKTTFNKYLFFQMSHLLSDGAGMAILLKDIETLYRGGTIRPSYYFAYLLDNSVPVSDEKMFEASEYYRKKLDPKNRMRNLLKDKTGEVGLGNARIFSVPINKIQGVVSKYDSTYAGFIHLMVCLAQEKYNGKPSFLWTFLENRSPNENSAGMRMTIGAIGITTSSRKLEDLFRDMNEQQYNMIRYSYYNYGAENPIDDDYSSLLVSYVSDWFDPESGGIALGKEIKLENQYTKHSKSRPILYLRVLHEKGKMVFMFQYDMKHLTEEHAEQFVSLMEHTANELLAERVPE